MVKLSAIQLCSVPDVDQNLMAIERQIEKLLASEQLDNTNIDTTDRVEHIIVLPECCLFFGGQDAQQLSLAKATITSMDLMTKLSTLAKKYAITLVAGTIPILAACGNKFTNTSCVFSPMGELLGQYDKIHLFDVNVNDNEKCYQESRYTQAGTSVTVINTLGLNLGLSVCFDVRFPSLYQKLSQLGADIITVPSAFTRVTGKAHWQALLQARAIENQVYIVAAAQEGIHANGRETWGHSLIISPWGEIINCLEQGEGIITTPFNPEEIIRVRTAMPVQNHNKFKVELKNNES